MHNNNIIIDLRVSKDNVGEIILIVGIGGIGGAVPSIDARSVETQVLIADGQTVVLSGIYEAERRETTKKTPFLGNLFRNKECTESNVELLIFVTPRTLKEGSSIY